MVEGQGLAQRKYFASLEIIALLLTSLENTICTVNAKQKHKNESTNSFLYGDSQFHFTILTFVAG